MLVGGASRRRYARTWRVLRVVVVAGGTRATTGGCCCFTCVTRQPLGRQIYHILVDSVHAASRLKGLPPSITFFSGLMYDEVSRNTIWKDHSSRDENTSRRGGRRKHGQPARCGLFYSGTQTLKSMPLQAGGATRATAATGGSQASTQLHAARRYHTSVSKPPV
jgi:hypothetical protein